jgi:hypothetical protein
MATSYQFWQHKKTEDVFAVKLRDGSPIRYCGPLKAQQYKTTDGRLLNLKLEFYHYDRRFTEDSFNYILCEDVKDTKPEDQEASKASIGV